MATSSAGPRLVRFGPFEADLYTRELRKQGLRIRLQDQPFQILAMLLRNPGELVTREQIREQLWAEDTFVDFDNGLNAAVRRLRDALNDSADTPRFIETLPRRGYRFVAPVEVVAEPAAEPPAHDKQTALQPPPAAATPAGETSARRPPTRSWLLAYAIIAVSAAVLVSYLWWAKEHQPLDSLAVLPLLNSNHDPQLDYLGDGIAESVISHLSQVPGLKVMSRNSAFRYRQPDLKPRQVAKELGVKALLLGSIRQNGDELRIAVELVDAADEHQIWGEDYTRKLASLSGIQSEIATAVSQHLRLRLSEPVLSRIAGRDTANAEAYRFYLRGTYALGQRTMPALREGREYFQRALQLDPDYARAYTGLAASYGLLAFYSGMRPREALVLEAEAIRKALALDPGLAEAHAQSGYYAVFPKHNPELAEAEIKRAIELSPNSSDAHHAYALFFMHQARFDESIVEAKRALELDPLWSGSYGTLADMNLYAGNYDEAIRLLASEKNYPLAFCVLGLAYAGKRNFEEAVRTLESPTAKGLCPAALGYAYALAGREREARSVLGELIRRHETEYFSGYEIAIVYAGLGDQAQMFRWLRTACDDADPHFQRLSADWAVFGKYRSRPEYSEIARCIEALGTQFP